MNDRSPIKRISIMVREDQYERLSNMGINLSAYIRDLIDDQLSEDVITLRVSRKTQQLYSKVVANTGATDEDIEPLLIPVLKKLLDERIQKIKSLKDELE